MAHCVSGRADDRDVLCRFIPSVCELPLPCTPSLLLLLLLLLLLGDEAAAAAEGDRLLLLVPFFLAFLWGEATHEYN